jgi:hypothetical protein
LPSGPPTGVPLTEPAPDAPLDGGAVEASTVSAALTVDPRRGDFFVSE